MWKPLIALVAVAAWTACSDSQTSSSAPADPGAVDAPAPTAPAPAAAAPADSGVPSDGELAFPEGYQSWPVYLTGIQKLDTKQIRDIFINSTAQAAAGAPLPDGSALVMEIYSVQVDDAGEAVLDDAGNLQKAGLSKVYLMEKNAGWGGGATVTNGAWVYGAFEPNGDAAAVDYNGCRACHLPMAEMDFVPRLEEYLAQK